jgi:hypothetical protein
MNKEPEPANSLDPLEAFNTIHDANLKTWKAMRDASLQAWSRLMIDFVNSDAYSHATGEMLDTYLTVLQPFQRALETTMTQSLASLNMPSRTEVTSLAERMTNIEMRLDDLDAKLDEILQAIQKQQQVSSQKQPSSSRASKTSSEAKENQ